MFIRTIIDNYMKRLYPDVDEATFRREFRDEKELIGQNVAARFSRGNTSIQRGAFISEDDMRYMSDELRKRYG